MRGGPLDGSDDADNPTMQGDADGEEGMIHLKDPTTHFHQFKDLNNSLLPLTRLSSTIQAVRLPNPLVSYASSSTLYAIKGLFTYYVKGWLPRAKLRQDGIA